MAFHFLNLTEELTPIKSPYYLIKNKATTKTHMTNETFITADKLTVWNNMDEIECGPCENDKAVLTFHHKGLIHEMIINRSQIDFAISRLSEL